MALCRRSFLRRTFAAGGLVAYGVTVPTFLARTARAAADSSAHADRILVVVQLTGGNDGLNTVIPFKDPEYVKLRPTLKIAPAQVRKINDEIGLHPAMSGLADLQQQQALCVVQGVGYPNPSQSHFRSMDIWQAGSLDESLTEGWIGKALKQMPAAPSFHLTAAEESAPLALAGAPVRVPSIARLEDFQLRMAAANGGERRKQRELIETVSQPSADQPNLLDFVKRTAVNTYESSKRLQEMARNYRPETPYPNTGLANRLKLAAQLIDAGLGARIFYVSLSGFDTHVSQANAHTNLLRELSDAMTAFFKDMTKRGHKDRILMMTFSEFGRRARENGGQGTDHGSAAPVLLVGGKVKAGVVGAHPSLTQLEQGNLKHHTDFRQVYASILDGWLGISSKDVLGDGFKPVEVFRG